MEQLKELPSSLYDRNQFIWGRGVPQDLSEVSTALPRICWTYTRGSEGMIEGDRAIQWTIAIGNPDERDAVLRWARSIRPYAKHDKEMSRPWQKGRCRIVLFPY